ncbi:MAG TPA: endo-1,4-beta-xylanase [Anaerolineales bacterium]
MSTVKTILSIVVVFVLASCSTSTPAATTTPIPTNTPQPTVTATATPAPRDVPVYRNSFEGISDLAASGITSSDADVTPNTENFNYPGPGTALEVKGTLPGEAYSSLDADFSILNLTGETSLDLSNKTFGISFFLPQDSPIQGLDVIIHSGDKVVILSASSGTGWTDYQLDIKNVYENKSWVYTNAADDEAQDMIRHCAKITLAGVRNTAGTPVETEFYLDDLNWIGIDINHIPVNGTVDSLRKYAANQHFKIGLFDYYCRIIGCPGEPADPWYAYTVAQEGTIHDASFFPILPDQDYSIFDYSPPEDAIYVQMYNFANGNSLTTVGYALGQWYTTVPQWVRDLAFPDETRALLFHSIEKDLRYTQGQHPIWILFNEAVQGFNGAIPHALYNWEVGLNNRQNTSPPASDCCYSPWSADINDSSLIKAAFIKAHEVDPGATLIFNGQSNEVEGWPVADYYYQFTSDLKAQGIPIDGVGFEMHNFITPDGRMKFWILSPSPDFEYVYMTLDEYLQKVDLNVKRYASQGLKVAFTEVDGFIKIDDIDLTTAAGRAEYDSRLQWQAKYYAGLLKIAMENDNVILYRVFEITEKFPDAEEILTPGYGNSGIFDKNYHPKPSYDAMLELLKAP